MRVCFDVAQNLKKKRNIKSQLWRNIYWAHKKLNKIRHFKPDRIRLAALPRLIMISVPSDHLDYTINFLVIHLWKKDILKKFDKYIIEELLCLNRKLSGILCSLNDHNRSLLDKKLRQNDIICYFRGTFIYTPFRKKIEKEKEKKKIILILRATLIRLYCNIRLTKLTF